MNVLIVTGGRFDEEFALGFLKKEKIDEIIAVDGGLAYVASMEEKLEGDLPLTHLVGDFDTISENILLRYKKRQGLIIHEYQPEKDYTDTDIALKLAIDLIQNSKQYGEIYMISATGTRLDHVLANMQMLITPMQANIPCYIVDKNNYISMITGTITITKQKGYYLSIIPVTMQLKGVTLIGFKYPLKDHTVNLGQSLCVSNEIKTLPATIQIKEGIALMIESVD